MAANMAKPLKYSNAIWKRLQMIAVRLVVYEFSVPLRNEMESAIGFSDKIHFQWFCSN